MEENWRVLSSLFPVGWQQMARPCGAIERLRGFRSSDVLLRMILLHVAKGYSLRETSVQAKLANWADISDVALLKRLRQSEEWLRSTLRKVAEGKWPFTGQADRDCTNTGGGRHSC
jgi:hypothetical protein